MNSGKIGVNIADTRISQLNVDKTAPVSNDAGTFSREEVDGKHRKPASAGHVGPAGHAGAVATSPITEVAHGLLSACDALQAKLNHEGAGNPAYLGSLKGEWVYRNPETKQVCIENLDVKGGLLGLRDFRNVCAIEPDGRVFLNGDPVTMSHPEAAKVEQSLTKLLQKIASDDLPRNGFGGNSLMPPWNPNSPAYGNYAH